ncbi:flagellar FlbD family protein [Virgibacillus kekensis]|uniref:Flagellar FlbD family protein n=1 Tax=Virgibacillus kekensis TaxID=202261 RepID=A0ABV9DGC6_9BACI
MIQLTRLNGELFSLNAIMIEQIQSYPDTTITLMNGKKIVVRNSEKDVVQEVTNYYEKIGVNGWFKKAGETDD